MNNEQTNNVPSQNSSPYLIPGSILLAGVLIALGVYLGGTHGAANKQAAATGTNAPTAALPITTDGEPYIGNPNAPLTVYYWSDYQCPFCKQFESTSLQSLITDYVKTNKVKVVFKDLQFLGNDSITSAHIARAIWELYPDKYYTWREGYFEKQDAEGDVGFGNEATVIAYTRTVAGIDADKVEALATQKANDYQALINADGSQASTNGIQGTPGVMVGKQVSSNPLNYASLKAMVDAQLK
jgi:protein-disulfide isomerase